MLPERLEVVCTQSLAWGMREQEPKRHGTTDVQICLCLTLTASEEANVQLDPEEYVESRWIGPADILEGNFHPALQFAVSSLLAVLKLQARSLFGPHASSWRDGSKETAAKRRQQNESALLKKKLRRSLFARQELRAAVAEASISDTGIAKLAREFVELSGKSPKQGTSNYRVVSETPRCTNLQLCRYCLRLSVARAISRATHTLDSSWCPFECAGGSRAAVRGRREGVHMIDSECSSLLRKAQT